MNKILIVEDEVSIAELEKDYLELSGFEVDMEHSGDTGLEKALKNDYNLIILDLMLDVYKRQGSPCPAPRLLCGDE